MNSDLSLTLQTIYAELLDRAASSAFDEAFAEAGNFTPKTLRGRRYWYFQTADRDGARRQRYAGPETPELLERIAGHRKARNGARDRRGLVSTLLRLAHLSGPRADIGKVADALSRAGVFRKGGVLVGTVAYQTYSPSLGVRLTASSVRTDDIDIAQAGGISVVVREDTASILEALKKADNSFAPVPHMNPPTATTTYRSDDILRVEFLVPNRGRDERAARLESLGTDAQPLRFLDFLIRDAEGAVLLHDEGVYVRVPTPERYAVHKLIVARLRTEGSVKIDKDLRQAGALLEALASKRPHQLRAAWDEAFARGPRWRRLMGEGLGRIDPAIRDRALKTVEAKRSVVPGLNLTFAAPPMRYDFDRDIVQFLGQAGGATVRCAISREALEDRFGADGAEGPALVKIVRDNREAVEAMARKKFLGWPVEEPGVVLIKTDDVAGLAKKRSKP